jgi:sugar phosphate isomerase/epimerase
MMAPHTDISRRSFLALAGALPFVLKGAAAAAGKVPVGLELYSVRDELMKDLPATVRAVGKMGYEIVEFYSPYYSWTPEKAKEVRKLLDDTGLRCRSTHNDSTSLTAENLPKAIELNQIIGSKYLIMASPGRVTGIDSWKTVADRLNAAAEKLKTVGLATGYHNHQTEWMPVEGQRPMDVLASATTKDVVLQLDVGTCIEAGSDPVAWIKSHPGRIRSIHCKDWAPGEGRGYGVIFGEGSSPWPKIFEAAESGGGVEYYLIEQEQGPATEQLQRAERCLANYRKLRG